MIFLTAPSVGNIPVPVWFGALSAAFVIAIALAVLMVVLSLISVATAARRVGVVTKKFNEQIGILKQENAKLAAALIAMQEQSHPPQPAVGAGEDVPAAATVAPASLPQPIRMPTPPPKKSSSKKK